MTITPTTVVLGPGHATALVSITNESDQATRFETTLNAWAESPEGETTLQPNSDVVVFPQLITLSAHETKKIRIGTETTPAGPERSYRLILQELPALNRASGVVEIQVLSKISLPVFVAPANAKPQPAITGATLQNGTLSFTIANSGSAHFIARKIMVSGRGADGAAFALDTNGWYVLPGGRRIYTVSLAANDCKRSTDIVIRAEGDMPTAETHVPVTPAACGAGGESRFLKTAVNPS